jgi:hypothetical protein
VYHPESISQAASLFQCTKAVSRDIGGVALQSLCVLFIFHVGIQGILEEGALVIVDLYSGMGSGGSQLS